MNAHSRVKKVIGVVSGKDGVGKSSVTSLLALAKQREGYKVAILDGDITGPSIGRIFGVENKQVLSNGKEFTPVESSQGIKIMSTNLLLESNDTPVIWRGPVLAGMIKQFWSDVMWGNVDYMFVDMPADRTGYLHKASLLQDMSAVTAACLLMKKEVFEQAGGFTEELAVAFNDVDLCLKVRKNGYLIVYDPYAKLYHMESKTRGAEDSKEKVRRFQTEIEYMRCHWIDILKNGDPCYNKNLSLTKWNYSLKPILGMETEAGQKKEKAPPPVI